MAKAWVGESDFNANVAALAQQAYNYFGVVGAKEWALIRPTFLTDGALQFSLGLAVDFAANQQLAVVSYPAPAGGVWDVDSWDSAIWGGDKTVQQAWETTASPVGYCSSIILQVATKTLAVSWVSTDYFIKPARNVLG